MNTKISIVTGLPGSGKTTLAKKMYEEITKNGYGKECILISLDNYPKNTFNEIMEKILDYHSISCSNFIIEGLLLTNDSIVDVLNAFTNHRKVKGDITVDIHYFNEDREACLHNDIGRRAKSARITIQNEKYETPDCEYISKETGLSCKLQKHIVVRKSNYDMFCDVNNIVNKEKLLSDSWSLGGTFGNCWNDQLTTLSPEPPQPFTEFDELLERICPNLTFLQYKKLERECTEIAEYEDSDYYGGTEYRAYHKCDLRKLYNLLDEMGYINLEELKEKILSMQEEVEGMER